MNPNRKPATNRALARSIGYRPLIGLMPQATLAAVAIVYSIGLIKPVEFRNILSIRRTEFIIALAYQVADPPVYVLGSKPGTNVLHPRSEENPEDETFAGLLLLRLEGRIFFVHAEHVAQEIKTLIDEAQPKVVVLHLRGVPDLEYTALKMLSEGEKIQRERGIKLWLIGMNPRVLAVIQKSPLGQAVGPDAMHFNLEMAVAKYLGEATSAAS